MKIFIFLNFYTDVVVEEGAQEWLQTWHWHGSVFSMNSLIIFVYVAYKNVHILLYYCKEHFQAYVAVSGRQV